jgi:hypothetical protein
LDQSLWSANQWVAVKSYVLYLFIAVRSYLLSCTLSFIRLSIPWKIARPKSLCWDYFLIQFDFVRPHTEHPWSCSKGHFPCDQPNQYNQHQWLGNKWKYIRHKGFTCYFYFYFSTHYLVHIGSYPLTLKFWTHGGSYPLTLKFWTHGSTIHVTSAASHSFNRQIYI